MNFPTEFNIKGKGGMEDGSKREKNENKRKT